MVFRTRRGALGPSLSVAVALMMSGCGGAGGGNEGGASRPDGLSDSPTANNVAALVQGNISEAINDMNLLEPVLGSSAGNYNFDVTRHLSATTASVAADLASDAQRVSRDGTLLVYLGGHGSPDGGTQMNDGQLFYYSQMRSAIAGALSHKIRRLVLVLFSCYSGSWIDNIDHDGGEPESAVVEDMATRAFEAFGSPEAEAAPIYDELIVMTSSSTGQLSYFTPGGASHFAESFANTFNRLAQAEGSATIGEFVDGVRGGVTSSTVALRLYPESLRSEPLLNSN